MAAAKNQNRTNTPTEQNKEDNSLVLYRLELVEAAVKDLGKQLSGRDTISKQDLIEFRAAILERFDEKNKALQDQIDDKAEKKDVEDLKGLVKAGGALITSVLGGLILYYLTVGSK